MKNKLFVCIVVFVFAVVALYAKPREAQAGGGKGAAIVVGTVLGLLVLGDTWWRDQRERTNRHAIDSAEKVDMERLKVTAILAAPAALGGANRARYNRTSGEVSVEYPRADVYQQRVRVRAMRRGDAQPTNVSAVAEFRPLDRSSYGYPRYRYGGSLYSVSTYCGYGYDCFPPREAYLIREKGKTRIVTPDGATISF